MPACKCSKKPNDIIHPGQWRVVHFRCNYSAFNGYRYTPSDYSLICCLTCGHAWRTKAAYVNRLADITEAERAKWLSGNQS